MKKKEQETQSLLKKKISELTFDDLAKLEKPLGTPDRPFPMWGTVKVMDETGKPTFEQRLTKIADAEKPMMVHSDRPYAEVMALAYCDMPVPSMLTNMYDILERARPECKNRSYMMIGDPGFGKSFLGALIGRLGSRDPVDVLDCGGKNMRELLFEMVLDFGSNDALPTAIDKRLESGAIQGMSVGLLKSIPGNYVTEAENGKVVIDWAALKESGPHVEKAFEVLTKVSKIEGLDNAGGNALGMNSQYGPAIRAFVEGRPIVFDEYNKSREGTDDNLQTYLQFVVGEIDTCTVQNPLKNKDNTKGPDSFTFRREDMRLGHIAVLTGNKKEDGTTTRSLNKSVYSRLDPQVLQDPTAEDWQHRLCQIMSGVPVSTLYNTFREKADKDPEAFGEWLLSLRRTKADLVEKKPVSPLQETLLRNWPALVNATERMGKFYHKWQQLTDVDKAAGTDATLGQEVDEEYSKRTSIDFRKVIKHVEEAIPVRPRMTALGHDADVSLAGWDKPPVYRKKEVEDVALHFGTRMTDLLMRKVYETSGAIAKPNLYRLLKAEMAECGLKDIHLNEGARSHQKAVEDLLNITVFRDKNRNVQANLAQRIMCDYLRSVDPNIATTDNEQIVTTTQMSAAIDEINRQSAEGRRNLMVVNDDHRTLSKTPFVAAKIVDSIVDPDRADKVRTEDLLNYREFVTALVMPGIGDNNRKSIWDNNVSDFFRKDEVEAGKNVAAPAAAQKTSAAAGSGDTSQDVSVEIAENRSASGLGVTSIIVRDKDKKGNDYELLTHVIVNTKRDRMIVVGSSLPENLEKDLEQSGIVHVDRNARGAKAKLGEAMNDLLQGVDEEACLRLKEAFAYRSRLAPEQSDHDIKDVLVDNTIEPRLHKLAVSPKFAA